MWLNTAKFIRPQEMGSEDRMSNHDSGRTLSQKELTEEIDFEIFPYGDSGNGTAAAARYSAGLNRWCGGVQ